MQLRQRRQRQCSHIHFGLAIAVALCCARTGNASTPCAFAAGGFGGGKSSSKSKGKQKKPRKGFGTATAPSQAEETIAPVGAQASDAPKLDKWGLPEMTQDDLFPPMPAGTELLPVEQGTAYKLADMQLCLQDHIDMKLDRCFDEEGVQKGASQRSPCRLNLLHRSPPVLQIDNFFTPQECNDIKSCTDGAYEVGSATFQGALSTRTSTSWFCNYDQVPTLLAKANGLLNIPIEVMEEPQIVRYKQGQQFSWHYDEVPRPQLSNGGQRSATLLVYLNDMEGGGGGTVFRDLKSPDGTELTMQPKEGSALLFFPSFADGRPDDRTLHKGDVIVGEDEKWIIQMWIHERGYSASLPPGNLQHAALGAIQAKLEELGLNDV